MLINRIIAIFAAVGFALSCGSSDSGSKDDGLAGILSEIEAWSKLDRTIEQQDEFTWIFSWPASNTPSASYAVFISDDNGQFDFNSPASVETDSLYRYTPKNIFTETSRCFIVRIVLGGLDDNQNKVCNQTEPVVFNGLDTLEQQTDGAYLLSWQRLPITGIVYTIFERQETSEYNFNQPSFDAIPDDSYKLPLYPRGEIRCFLVRYYHPDFEADVNNKEICNELEDPLEFGGITAIERVDASTLRLIWTASPSADVSSYMIYQNSDFSEQIGLADGNTTFYEVSNLLPNQQYSFGVRAADGFGRQDNNLIILSITN